MHPEIVVSDFFKLKRPIFSIIKNEQKHEGYERLNALSEPKLFKIIQLKMLNNNKLLFI